MLARIVLGLLVRGPEAGFLRGDIEEEYARRCAEHGREAAHRWYRRQARGALLAWWRPANAWIRRGRNAPRPPRAQRRSLPGEVRIPEFPRNGGPMFETIVHDLRYALRSLGAHPTLSFVIVVTLALGIGANAAIYSFVDGILLRRLPYADPEALAFVNASNAETGSLYDSYSYAEFARLREATAKFAEMTAYSFATREVTAGNEDAREVACARVTDGFLRVLGTPPLIGRDFEPGEYRRGDAVIIVSHRFSAEQLGGDEGVIGTVIDVAGQPHEVVGVMPPDFVVPANPDTAFIAPMTERLRLDDDRELNVLGRLAAGATIEQAAVEMAGATEAMAGSPDARPGDEQRSAWVESAHDSVVRSARAPLSMILASAVVVLLIGCVNVSSLLLARGEMRRHELAVRCALGAGRWRLMRQLLIESLLLSAIGCLVGILVAAWLLPALVALSPADTPRLDNVSMNAHVVLAMVAVAMLAAIVFGAVPTVAGGSPYPASTLATSGRTATASRRSQRWQGRLLTAEMALAAVLLFGAVLFTTTFARMAAFDRGFTTRNTAVISVRVPEQYVATASAARGFFEQLSEMARNAPAVTAVGFTFRAPDRGRGLNLRMLEPRGFSENSDALASVTMVGSGFFLAAGIPLLEGRAFEPTDVEGSASVAVVNQTFARLYLRDREPLGARFEQGNFGGEPIETEVVGVVGDIFGAPGGPALPMLYLPSSQIGTPFGELVVRYEGELEPVVAAIREDIGRLAPRAAPPQVRTMAQAVAESVAEPRFHMYVVGLFAGLALVVSAVGVYATTAFSVSSRLDEIGVRQALGAERGDLVRMFLRQGLARSVPGVAAGLLLSVLLGRLVESLLFEVAPVDLWVHATVLFALALLALAASALPAVRAARVSPMQVMRSG